MFLLSSCPFLVVQPEEERQELGCLADIDDEPEPELKATPKPKPKRRLKSGTKWDYLLLLSDGYNCVGSVVMV